MTIAEQMAADAAAAPAQSKLSIAQQMAADGAAAAPAPARPVAQSKPASSWNRDVEGNEAMGGMLIHGLTGLGSSIIGGYRGLATLAFPDAMGGDPNKSRLDNAVDAINSETSSRTYNPDPSSNTGQLVQAAASKYSPTQVFPNIAHAAGDAVNSLPNSANLPVLGQTNLIPAKAALAAGTDAGIQVFGPVSLMKVPSGVGAVRSTLRNLTEASRISPAEAAANAQSLSQRAAAAVGQDTPQSVTQPMQQPATAAVGAQTTASPIAATSQSQAAAVPAPRAPTIADASPELQQKVVQAADAGQPINPAVVQRHVEAETLPVPIRLTEGQATLDPATISNEMNSRGRAGPPVPPEFYNQQGKALGQNLDAIRQQVAPDVKADNPTDHGQVLIDQYKAMDAPVVADINAKYQALRDANGGEFPVDAPQLLANTKAALKAELLTGDAPPSQMSALEGLADEGKMSYEQFLNLRRNLGNIARTSADGNQRAAAGVMVDQLEQLPLQGDAADMQPLAEAARSAARARFQAMDADPAYKAAVNDGVKPGEASPLADSFVQKYVVGAPRANVANMRANLADQPLAQQTIPAATIDYLRSKAKADVETGQFNAAAYNGVVDKLGPKFDQLMSPDVAQMVQQVGNVAKYTTTQPKGSYVNNSNTLVGAAGQVGLQFAKDALSTATYGASKAVGSVVGGVKAASASKAATAPGAGITRGTLDGLKGGDQ